VTMLEAAAHMAAGATGPAINIIGSNDPLDEYAPFIEAIAASRPFLSALREATGRSPAEGVWPAWNRHVFACYGADARRDSHGDWLARNPNIAALRQPYVLGELGLPVGYGPEGARVALLSGAIPASFALAELEEMFSGGVLLDVPALRSLERLGVGAWTGVRVVAEQAHDMSEYLSAHPLNGAYAGWSRDCRQSFWPHTAYRLEAAAEGVQELAHLKDYAGAYCGASMTAYTNVMGGRVVVAGYYPWMLIHNLAKASQMKAVCQWLSDDTLPAVVESYARAVVWARRDAQGRLALALLNASLDAAPALTLRARATGTRVQQFAMDGGETALAAEPDGPAHVRLTLRDVAPWSMHLLRWL